ncbi:hypothetical protein MN608_02216 [Microdochium nivale]|nr:hypothetical protein MN608_02216 [Microdochium nivale]
MELGDVDNNFINSGPMANTIRSMKATAFHHWGFPVYKAAGITNQDLWDKYMDALKRDVHEELEHNGREVLLESYASWPVLDLSNEASTGNQQDERSAVRRHFQIWRQEQQQSLGADAHPASTLAKLDALPRFRYCLYVDQKCLDTLDAHASAKATRKRPGYGPPMPALVAMVIDAGCGDDGEQQQQASYPGWQYYNLRYVAGLYDELHRTPLSESELYIRPPGVGPLGLDSM